METALKGAHLSLQQQRLWGFQQDSNVYRIQCMVRLEGKIDRVVFLRVLQQITARYEILQTLFYTLPGMDIPLQVIGHHAQMHCPLIHLELIATAIQKGEIARAFASLQNEPFDLARGPLLRMALIALSTEVHILLVGLPALCADTLTLPALINETGQRYQTALQEQSEEEEEPLQYTAVSAWQQKILAAENALQPREFWRKVNMAALAHMPLPFESEDPTRNRAVYHREAAVFEPRKLTIALTKTVSETLSALALEHHVSLETVLLVCWYLTLARLTNEPAMMIGVASDGRVYEELRGTPGLYTRFLPLSLFCTDEQLLSELLTTTHLLLQESRQWQAYFAWSEDGKKAGPGFFPVLFTWESWSETITYGGISVSLLNWEGCTEPFLLKLRVLQIGETLQAELHYDPLAFSDEQSGRLCCAFQALLSSALRGSAIPVKALNLLAPGEQEKLMQAFQGPELPLPEATLQQLFEAQVRRFPDSLAVVSAEGSLTYHALDCRANQLAHVLRQRGVEPNVPVGLCIERSMQMIVGMFAILKAGGAYLPLDGESPAERLVYQLQNARSALLLTQRALLPHLPQWTGQILCLEDLDTETAQAAAVNLPAYNTPQDLVYIIYTSGSTGVPKGVMVRHRNAVHYALALSEVIKSEPGWQFATVSTLAADLGNTAIFGALTSGGCLQVLDYPTITSEKAFVRWCLERPIDVLKIVPSHLHALLSSETARAILPCRTLIVGGETFPWSLAARLRELQAGCEVYNHYGPTETTIGVLMHSLGTFDAESAPTRQTAAASLPIPLGRPLANMDVYVLNPWLHIVPAGVAGELYIGGAGVTAGYLQQPEMTAQRFLPHPFSTRPGLQLYRTGDLARYTNDGYIEFIGRGDNQIKLRGYRIEAGEIEAVLGRHENVRSAVVLAQGNSPGGPHLVGYIVPRKQPVPGSKELRDLLLASLPEYMLPSAFIYLKALPLTASGKVDRRQLAALKANDERRIVVAGAGMDHGGQEPVLARDEIEFQLLRIWKELLQIETISVLDNFFNLGGHSILAVRLLAHIYQQFGQDLPLSILFEHPTIAELSSTLRQQGQPIARSAVVPLQVQGGRPPFFCIHPSGGTVFCYAELARCLGPDQPFYGIQTPYLHPVMRTWRTLEDMAAHYAAEIQETYPQGPYLLGGWSLGGVVALEVARQLHKQGRAIALLAIIDSVLADTHLRDETAKHTRESGDEEVVRALIRGYDVDTPENFERYPVEAQLNYVVEYAKKVNGIPSDINLEQIRLYYRAGLMNIRLARLYEPRRYPLPLDYFISGRALQNLEQEERPDGPQAAQRRNNRLKPWQDIADGGLELHPVEGDHGSIIEGADVPRLAEALRKRIDRLDL